MRRAVMRCAVIPLLLSACAGVPESPTGTYGYEGSSLGPNGWGYTQGMAIPGGAPCFYPGNPSLMGPPYSNSYGGSYDCATTLPFYVRNSYVPYYSAPRPVPMTHPRHMHSSGTAHKSSGHHGKRK